MLSAGIATAQEAIAPSQDALTFVVGAGIRYDDNVFRLQSDVNPQAVAGSYSKSDRILFATLGAKFDQIYSQQRFLVSAGITDNRYRNFSYLSFVAKEYQAEWQWYLTSRLTGRVAADRAQALSDFRDYQFNSTRNIVTTENRHFVADFWVDGGWHLVGGVVENRQTNSQQTGVAAATSRLRSGEGGVRYATEGGDSLALLTRQGNGEYPDRAIDPVALLDNRFSQDEIELALGYRLSGKSTITGRLVRVERKHDHFPQRDYKGTVGMFDWRWNPTGQLGVDFVAARDLINFQDPTTSYYVNDRLSIAPSWMMSAKTSLGLRYEQGWRDYRGAVTPITVSRKDRDRIVGVNLVWAPSTTVSVTGSVLRETLTSNISTFGYTANIVSLVVQATF
jgi:exopolysaccharide biosynthesis operon protein EpsL